MTAAAVTTPVVPAAPFATSASISSSNQGGVSGTVSAGSQAVVTVPNGTVGETVYVYGYSTPVYLGSFVLNASKQATVSFAALPGGAHHLVVVSASGATLGWLAVSVAALASTGAGPDTDLISMIAGLVLLAGLALTVIARRRRSALTR